MRTIMMSYPRFRSLPKGVRRMLVMSEQHFFDELTNDTLKRASRAAEKQRIQATVRQRDSSHLYNEWGAALRNRRAPSSVPAAQW